METIYYLDKFNTIVDQFDKKLFIQNQLEWKVGVWLNSVALKIQKKSWINKSPDAKPLEESIFFSVWINDESIRDGKLYFNVHALKLRQLKGYSIRSREFAEAFRTRFGAFEKQWPNVSLQFGPQTLMEGWVRFDLKSFENEITDLACKFLEIQFIIDDLLAERKK